MKSLFGLLLLCLTVSLAAAETPLPDTQGLWAAYQQDADQNAKAWQEAVKQINDQVVKQVFETDAQYREADQKLDSARDALKKTEATLMGSGLIANLNKKMIAAYQEFKKMASDGHRGNEMTRKQQEMQNYRRQIYHLIAINPEIVRLNEGISKNQAELTRRAGELLAASSLPAAKLLRDTKVMAKDYFDQDSILLISRCEAAANPFADLYQGLTREKAEGSVDDDYYNFIANNVKRENPGADPQKIALYAKAYVNAPVTFPGDPKQYLAPGKTPFDELYNTVAAKSLNAIDANQAILRLRKVALKLPDPSFTRWQAMRFISGCTTDEAIRATRERAAGEQALKLVTEGKVDNDSAAELYSYFNTYWDDDNFKKAGETVSKCKDQNSWLCQMILGRAAVVRAWEARGGGYSYTITAEGGAGFKRELAAAQKAFYHAIKLRPELADAYAELIPTEMAVGDTDKEIKLFKKAVRLDPVCQEAYRKIIFGLVPKWGGSIELLTQLGDAAVSTPYPDSVIPVEGFNAYKEAVYYYPDYRWKNVYTGSAVNTRGDQVFAAQIKASTDPNLTRLIKFERAMFEMATLRYDQAAATVAEIGGDEAFANCIKRSEEFSAYPIPQLNCDNIYQPVLLRLFTGPQKNELCALEKRYLDGEDMSAQLLQLIHNGKFTNDEKDALYDLYGRWSMECGPKDYLDCEGESANALQVAGSQGYPDLFREILKSGCQYQKYEAYPGQTAILIARNGTETELLDILKQAGDPLNRTEPEHGHAPIHLAAIKCNAPMIKKLLSLGTPPDTLDGDNHTALQIAAAYGGVDAVQLLLAAGADPDKQDNDGDVALFFVMEQNGPRQVWEMLIKKTKNINVTDSGGQTVLHHAAEHLEQGDAIRALLAAGADPRKKDNGGNTPADLARKRGRADLAAILDK